MEKNYYVGRCPICGYYGQLEVCKNEKNNQCLVMCDEYLAEWKNPEDALQNINGHRGSIQEGKVVNATLDEIIKIGWDKFIVNR